MRRLVFLSLGKGVSRSVLFHFFNNSKFMKGENQNLYIVIKARWAFFMNKVDDAVEGPENTTASDFSPIHHAFSILGHPRWAEQESIAPEK